MASNLRTWVAHHMRQWADRLDPQYPLLPDVELVHALRREAAEFGMADESSRIKREQEAQFKKEWPRLRDEFKAACKENERRLRSVK